MAINVQASGTYIDHGSAASLDNLVQSGGVLTVWAWVYRIVNGNNQHIITKDNTGATGWDFVVVNGGGEGQLRFIAFRSTTNQDFISASGVVPLEAWTFVAATIDAGASNPQVHLYAGSPGVDATEVSYTTQTA